MQKIMVQDTDSGVLDVLMLALRAENFDVHAIREFDHDFMDIIEKFRPHVIMLDYHITGKRAIEILTIVKEKYKHLPIIALSCNYNINVSAVELGFDDYIRKPFDLEILYKIIHKHMPDQPVNQQQ